MPNTLRRKMFKLGGVANTHGVGITSGLKMKKGGVVPGKVGDPILTKKGPDGKEREMQNPVALLNYLGVGVRTIPTLAKGIQNLIQRRGIQPITNFIQTGRLGGEAAKVGEIASRPTRAQIARMKPEEIDRIFGSRLFGFGPRFGQFSRAAQIGRTAEIATPLLAPVGIASALSPRMERGKDKPIGTLVENIREVPEAALDLLTGAPAGALGLLSGQGMSLLRPSAAIQKARGFMPDEEDKPDEKDDTPQDTAEKIEAEMEALKDRAEAKLELYRDLTGRPDNAQAIARALTAFGATAAQGTGDDKADLAAALAAGSSQLFDEAAKRQETDQRLTTLAIQDVLADDQAQRAILAQAATRGPDELLRTQRVLEALNAGITQQLQLDTNNNILNPQKGTVYVDVTGASGKKYVAVNQSLENKSFDDANEAKEFAKSKSA